MCVAALALTALVLTLASLASAGAPGRSLPRATLEAKTQAIRDYWTPQRMRKAEPVDSIATPLSAPRARAAVRGRDHHSHKKVKAKPVKRSTKKPLRAHGKVFFRLADGDYVCSGTSLRTSTGVSMVWTAGHCVFDERPVGGFASAWEFVPAYHGGKAPFGEWPASALATTKQWQGGLAGLDGGDSAYDFGAATVGGTRGGKTLQQTVGGRKIGFFTHLKGKLMAIGYPAVPPFTGKRELSCKSRTRGRDRRVGPPHPIGISCDMTGGASGGGWIDKKGRLVSVTSYGYTGLPNVLFGPYQGNVAERLYYENGGA